MIQLVGLLWGMALVFGFIGFMRGLSRELIATAGIILGLFALFQFDDVLRGTLLPWLAVALCAALLLPGLPTAQAQSGQSVYA
ncbi:MAG: hypothetical protein DWB42_19935, partial [Chloroflexi bacterium]|nr:hypothetical protein [Chloroflexota bacterium]